LKRKLGIALLLVAAVAVGLGRATVFRPMDFPYTAARATADVGYWDLPTGSRLAYVRVAGAAPGREAPVVYLHGGPGQAEFLPAQVASALAAEGFDVWSYHQYGAGLSSRAPVRRRGEYTVGRHVADLEAVRAALGAERLILLGQSWGGTLAANYAAAHPGRIEKLVLSAPGPAWLPAFELAQIRVLSHLSQADQAELAELITPYVSRLAFHRWLLGVHPGAAELFLGERQLDGFLEAQVTVIVRAYACDPRAASELSYPGQGYWVNRHVFADMRRVPDPRPRLRAVQAPVLILKPECDYVDEGVVREYSELFPNAVLLRIEGAGHEIRLERPREYVEAIRAFLAGEPATAEDPAAP
jgi:proline iminopeptidase